MQFFLEGEAGIETLKHDHWAKNETSRGSVIRKFNQQPEARVGTSSVV